MTARLHHNCSLRLFPSLRPIGGLVAGAALALGLGCSSYPESEYPSNPPSGVSPEEDPVVPAPPGAVWRTDVVAAVDAGLGYFLQRVEVEAELLEDRFVGFRVMALRPPSWWQGIDLSPGDIVQRVNSMPIEQPAEAHAAFESLRTAKQVVIAYLRGGESRELRYQILDAKPASRER